jgi:hypothetical protein
MKKAKKGALWGTSCCDLARWEKRRSRAAGVGFVKEGVNVCWADVGLGESKVKPPFLCSGRRTQRRERGREVARLGSEKGSELVE